MRTIAVESDREAYGDYYDWGYWSGTEWKGYQNLPAGYWVYIAPNWHIFAESAEGPRVPRKVNSTANQVKRAWGPEQAVGPPDTDAAGDFQTAWASATPDDQDEWLRLNYAHAVVPSAVHVYESFNPGALYRITARTSDGREVEIWSGDDPVPVNSGKGVAKVSVKADFPTKCITIHLKSSKVPGWNEIDAVGLLDAQENLQWAISAEASSTFADLQGASILDLAPVSDNADFNLRLSRLEEKVRRLENERRVIRGLGGERPRE